MRLPFRLLTQLSEVLQRPARPGRFSSSLWTEIQAQGWAYMHQLADLVEIMDDRMAHVRFEELAAAAGCVIRPMRDRPRFKNTDWYATQMIEAADVVGLCIFLEALGLSIDPLPMVQSLYDQIANKDRLTLAEGEIFCYSAMRHKQRMTLQSEGAIDATPLQNDWRGAAGRRYQALVRGGQVTSLTIQGPRWRRPRHVEMQCAVCGTHYTKGDPESALTHRRSHAEVMRLLTPRPRS